MIKHIKRAQLIREIHRIITEGPHICKYRGDGRAGALVEKLLGIKANNESLADAVGFEIKSSINSSTPVTLFHKDPYPRRPSATAMLVHTYGWPSEHHGEPVKSFRTTIWGSFKNFKISVIKNEKVVLKDRNTTLAYWDANVLVGAAAAKLKNMLYVEAKPIQPNLIQFIDAKLYETFQPLKFLKAIEKGIVAIDFDARTNPHKTSIRNHGAKFRIKERDLLTLYEKVTPLKKLL